MLFLSGLRFVSPFDGTVVADDHELPLSMLIVILVPGH